MTRNNVGPVAARWGLITTIGSVLFCLAAVAYLAIGLSRQTLESMDFRYIWLAGELWETGANPYSRAYIAAGAKIFPTGYPIASWAYPFHWYLPARLAALLRPEPAFVWWLGLTTAALAGAGWLVVKVARTFGTKLLPAAILIGVGFVASGSIVIYALRAGQPAVVAECGVALVLFGIVRQRTAWVIAGLTLAMLKPQLGLPFATAVCFMPGGVKANTLAVLTVCAASLPAFWASGLMAQVNGLLIESRSNYQTVSYNTAEMMTGLPNIVEHLTGWSMSILHSMVLASLLTAAASFASRGRPDGERRLMFATLTPLITTAVVGLHAYDLVVALFALPLAAHLGRVSRTVVLISYLCLWRTENVVVVLTGESALTPTVQSLALGVLLLVWVIYALPKRQSTQVTCAA